MSAESAPAPAPATAPSGPAAAPRRFNRDAGPRLIVINGVEKFGTFEEAVKTFVTQSRSTVKEAERRSFFESKKARRKRKDAARKRKANKQ